jgi:hypothetical protein
MCKFNQEILGDDRARGEQEEEGWFGQRGEQGSAEQENEVGTGEERKDKRDT